MNNECLPLSDLATGHIGVVVQLTGGRGFVCRLAALGFTPGVQVTMVQNLGHGPVIVMVRDTRVALGRGEANKVLVRPQGDSKDGATG
ncbi:MAG: ferrous iron transport protein A [Chloroflexi bacterium]|nr:ferrous iron transport protein A [Chloroflexota bacterium]